MSEQVLDYAIVGGGISGIYSAWRLKASDSALHIKVFEASDRVGGRLLTVIPPKMPSARVELGGMRYIVEEHPWVDALVKYLKLETRPLPAVEPQRSAASGRGRRGLRQHPLHVECRRRFWVEPR